MICLFCKENSSLSKSVEHIVPEALGNKSERHNLPKGVVCDKCNNYFASSVEGPLLSHESFRNLRARYQTPNKKGKMPFWKGDLFGTEFQVGLRLDKKTNTPEIRPERESQHEEIERFRRFNDLTGAPTLLRFSNEFIPPEKAMSRFLAKMAFEAICRRFILGMNYLECLEILHTDHYDSIREYARFGYSYEKWPFHYRQYFPEETLMKHPETSEWVQFGFGYDLLLTKVPETYLVFSIHGHEFAINLGGPKVVGYENWLEENNGISYLVEARGARVIESALSGKLQSYLYNG
ncbi:HNH endonuclease [Alisedimentitalea sp. MJ-SS2]|uniref:HNH endonuclease n=1 Tax=Aliisedimentitalea sp. MJ-SS2 TaxID=3049795 RepID=UPI002910289A|nr:HNH endonuclease [Alisedimentitalea sp. MJ-SS2]MDU8929440.1 HNH endonuclease [Alisedimentitalea sp. MJ-SS2]